VQSQGILPNVSHDLSSDPWFASGKKHTCQPGQRHPPKEGSGGEDFATRPSRAPRSDFLARFTENEGLAPVLASQDLRGGAGPRRRILGGRMSPPRSGDAYRIEPSTMQELVQRPPGEVPQANFGLWPVPRFGRRSWSAPRGNAAPRTGCFWLHASSTTPPGDLTCRKASRGAREALAEVVGPCGWSQGGPYANALPSQSESSPYRAPGCRSLSARRAILGDALTFASITLIMDPCNSREKTNR
jgi:hypothetical protein